jgi:hypothetical protein
LVADFTLSYASSFGSGLELLLIRIASRDAVSLASCAASSLKNTAVLAFDLAYNTPVVVAPVRSSATAPIKGMALSSLSIRSHMSRSQKGSATPFVNLCYYLVITFD